MTNEPRWEDIFSPRSDATPPPTPDRRASNGTDADATWDPFSEFTTEGSNTPAAAEGTASTPAAAEEVPTGDVPLTRRQLRELEAKEQTVTPAASASAAAASGDTQGTGRGGRGGGRPPRPRKSRRGLFITLGILLALIIAAGAAASYAWTNYEPQVRELLGWELPTDFEGEGTGEEVIVVIESGDIGSDVAQTLYDQGVTMTYEAFYNLLLENPDVSFHPGNYSLSLQMSARAALDALQDPANKVTQTVTIPEGTTLHGTLERLANATGTPIEDFEAAAADYTALGVPAEAPSLEGYLFPATYSFDPGQSAQGALQVLVNRMFQSLDGAGVAPEDRHRVLTIASLVQREARVEGDFFKVSRVVQNRLEIDMKLEFDSTSHYGAESSGSVWTTDEERGDDNPYNTYFHTGLPIGPIAAPGDVAIDAALNPEPGPWIFFVAVNLETGESVFTTTVSEHERAVEQLRAWCRESDENRAYCA